MRKVERATQADWQDTLLWHRLCSLDLPETEDVGTTLKVLLPEVQTLLSHANTAPTDFTLHDAQHSFRVANRMLEIIPEDVLNGLSPYELALLILSSYLHDIGMSPAQRLVKQHYTYALTGDENSLSQEQLGKFRSWLDTQEIGIPVSRESNNYATVRQTESLISNYSRDQHAAWGEEWIRTNLSAHRLGSYIQWVDDLCTLCVSHSEGYDYLVQSVLDPRPVGKHAYTVHLRYLACVLRVADILEFDPERTPDVVFNQRDISPGSIVYWHKDHEITMYMENRRRIAISARPSNAKTHRAILDMVDSIESELLLVQRLKDEHRFDGQRFRDELLPHRWDLLPSVRVDIKPRQEAYEFVDGAFRPDTQRLLQLLSGTELYGDPLVAIRELLQNSFDAVREQIAYERILRAQPGSEHWEKALGAVHLVRLTVETSDDGVWLICEDDGAGMSKSIIVDNLLVSGRSKQMGFKRLERRAHELGFRVGRTAKFGIGVLSYFMMADVVQIRTRRSGIADGAETHGWHFKTEGVGSFGELKRDLDWMQGTQVRLRIQDSLHERISAELSQYTQDLIRYAPCKVEIHSADSDISISHGWFPDAAREVVASDIVEQMLLTGSNLAEGQHAVLSTVEWRVLEGELPNGLGKFRLSVPLFQTRYGISPAFFWEAVGSDNNTDAIVVQELPRDGFFYFVGSATTSWNGMLVEHRKAQGAVELLRKIGSYGVLQLDWQSSRAGEVTVTREQVDLSEEAIVSLRELLHTTRDFAHSLISARNERELLFFHALYTNNWKSVLDSGVWLYTVPPVKSSAVIGKIAFPALDQNYFWFKDDILKYHKIYWNGESVSLLMYLKFRGIRVDRTIHHHSEDGNAWSAKSELPPSRLLEVQGPDLPISVTLLWEDGASTLKRTRWKGYVCMYPPLWAHVACTILRTYSHHGFNLVWNIDHPLAAVGAEDERWISEILGDEPHKAVVSLDPRTWGEALFERSGRAAAWLSLFLSSNWMPLEEERYWSAKVKLWTILAADDEFTTRLWRCVFGDDQMARYDTIFCVDLQMGTNGSPKYWKLSPRALTLVRDKTQLRQALPEPGSDYVLVVEKSDVQH